MTLTTILVACIGSSGLASIIVALLNRHWARKDKRDDKLDAVVSGLKVLTVDRVRYLGKGYIMDHEISLEDKENLEEMYRAYSPGRKRAPEDRHGRDRTAARGGQVMSGKRPQKYIQSLQIKNQ